MLIHAIPMPFRRDVQNLVGVVVKPKAFRFGEGISSVEGSVGNMVSEVVVTLIFTKHSPFRKEYCPAMSTNSHLYAWVALLPESPPLVPCVFTTKRVMMRGYKTQIGTIDKGCR